MRWLNVDSFLFLLSKCIYLHGLEQDTQASRTQEIMRYSYFLNQYRRCFQNMIELLGISEFLINLIDRQFQNTHRKKSSVSMVYNPHTDIDWKLLSPFLPLPRSPCTISPAQKSGGQMTVSRERTRQAAAVLASPAWVYSTT